MSDGKNGFSNFPEFDFTPIGQAIKKAREAKGITREQLSEVIDYAPRHIQSIENEVNTQVFNYLRNLSLCLMFQLTANQTHRTFTSAGFSASSVEKYHYALHLSSPPPSAIRFLIV